MHHASQSSRDSLSKASTNFFYDERDIQAAKSVFAEDGYCVFTNLLSDVDFGALLEGVKESLISGALAIRDDKMNVNNDAIFAHPAIEATCKNPSIVAAVRALIGHPVTLQHSKFNAKPIGKNVLGSEVAWHQDLPFYPHTNSDLVSCVVHLDDQDEDSGAMSFVPGSHILGEQSHTDDDGNFAYRCAEPDDRFCPAEPLLARRGWVSFHHALTIHCSGVKTNDRDRRLMVFQYRAHDAVQLAGVLWRCNGYRVDETVPDIPTAWFPDGSVMPLRGRSGRLFDVSGRLKPDASPN